MKLLLRVIRSNAFSVTCFYLTIVPETPNESCRQSWGSRLEIIAFFKYLVCILDNRIFAFGFFVIYGRLARGKFLCCISHSINLDHLEFA